MDDGFSKDLEAALGTRPVIEQAKGVLVALRGATPDQAFAELRYVSQHHNVKLNALAASLVDAACGRRVSEGDLEGALVSQWGDLLTRYSAVRSVAPEPGRVDWDGESA